MNQLGLGINNFIPKTTGLNLAVPTNTAIPQLNTNGLMSGSIFDYNNILKDVNSKFAADMVEFQRLAPATDDNGMPPILDYIMNLLKGLPGGNLNTANTYNNETASDNNPAVSTNKQANKAPAENRITTADIKVQEGARAAKDWLEIESGNQEKPVANATKINSQEKQKTKQTMYNKDIPVRAGNLGGNIIGQTNGSSITIDQKYANESSVDDIASTVLHEMHHIAFGGGSQQNEIDSEKFAESFRDEKGIGSFEDDSQISNWAKRNYTELPATGGRMLA